MKKSLIHMVAMGSVGASGCTEYQVGIRHNEPPPYVAKPATVTVFPDVLDFGMVELGEELTKKLTLTNSGELPLVVADVVVEGEGPFVIDLGDLETVDPSEAASFEVTFAADAGSYAADLLIASNAENQSQLLVEMTAIGFIGAPVFDPPDIDFGSVGGGCEEMEEVVLTNTSLVNMTIEVSSIGGAEHMSYVTLDEPMVLPSGEMMPVPVVYVPNDLGQHSSTLTMAWQAEGYEASGEVTLQSTGSGYGNGAVTDVFTVPPPMDVDVVVVVDRADSMSDDINDLILGLDSFIDTMESLGQTWQIGVATRNTGCINSGIIDANTLNIGGAFADGVTGIGSQELCPSECLLKIADAVVDNSGPGECNDGLLRPGARLHILTASDNAELSGIEWDVWLAGFQAGGYDTVVSTVTSLGSCGLLGSGYIEIAEATGGAVVDLCQPGWDQYIPDIARAAGRDPFEVSDATIVPGTLEVKVDGVVMTTGWSFNEERGTVEFDDLLDEGQTVTLTYDTKVCQ